ncbi:hypothetical protein N657DRAFT_153641 [Parathielavia appendiculata]|uniref:Uncharacterized protein n=1 Tax=Parathielavia appendiculata TaxID=2587402 RepID=A0AAN6TVI6_9PEZI|nr:hypothetical protein N657DRAFT_153641 [Parathielavia appendiculata]
MEARKGPGSLSLTKDQTVRRLPSPPGSVLACGPLMLGSDHLPESKEMTALDRYPNAKRFIVAYPSLIRQLWGAVSGFLPALVQTLSSHAHPDTVLVSSDFFNAASYPSNRFLRSSPISVPYVYNRLLRKIQPGVPRRRATRARSNRSTSSCPISVAFRRIAETCLPSICPRTMVQHMHRTIYSNWAMAMSAW